MQVILRIANGRSNVRKVRLQSDTIIGRSPECQLKVASNQISRRHCQILLRDPMVFIKDLGSGNGTFVNGRQVPPEVMIPLTPGTRVTLGPLQFTVEYDLPGVTGSPSGIIPSLRAGTPEGPGGQQSTVEYRPTSANEETDTEGEVFDPSKPSFAETLSEQQQFASLSAMRLGHPFESNMAPATSNRVPAHLEQTIDIAQSAVAADVSLQPMPPMAHFGSPPQAGIPQSASPSVVPLQGVNNQAVEAPEAIVTSPVPWGGTPAPGPVGFSENSGATGLVPAVGAPVPAGQMAGGAAPYSVVPASQPNPLYPAPYPFPAQPGQWNPAEVPPMAMPAPKAFMSPPFPIISGAPGAGEPPAIAFPGAPSTAYPSAPYSNFPTATHVSPVQPPPPILEKHPFSASALEDDTEEFSFGILAAPGSGINIEASDIAQSSPQPVEKPKKRGFMEYLGWRKKDKNAAGSKAVSPGPIAPKNEFGGPSPAPAAGPQPHPMSGPLAAPVMTPPGSDTPPTAMEFVFPSEDDTVEEEVEEEDDSMRNLFGDLK